MCEETNVENLSAERWDKAAGDFQAVFRLGQNEYNEGLFRFWEEEGLLRPGDRVLDLGCGVGKYGVLFARAGYRVSLADLSPEMLRLARENMAGAETPWDAFVCDFHSATGAEAGFAGGFDFAISTMSPAVCDADTVKKLSAMTRRCCFLSRFSLWEQPLRDAVLAGAGIAPREKNAALAADCEELLAAVRAAGYAPRTRTVDYDWCDRRSPEALADMLLRREIEGADEALRPALEREARRYAQADGLVPDAVHTRVLWLWWRTGE